MLRKPAWSVPVTDGVAGGRWRGVEREHADPPDRESLGFTSRRGRVDRPVMYWARLADRSSSTTCRTRDTYDRCMTAPGITRILC